MVVYYPTIEIPVLCICVAMWIFCCHVAKKHREADGWPPGADHSPSVYIIPMYEEGPEEEEEEEEQEVVDLYEAYFRSFSRAAGPPPPYTPEPQFCPDPPPSYTDPPAYSEHP